MTDIGRGGLSYSSFDYSVKTAIANRLSSLDDQFTIGMTDYFNHSYVPDLVLSWPRGGRPDSQRHVYIRSSVATPDLPEQIERLHEGRPIFVGVDSSPSWPDALEEALSTSQHALVTEDPAVEHFQSANGNTFNIGLGSSVARGGRGPLSQARASDISEGLAELNRGAEGRADEVATALHEVEALLDDQSARRFFRYLKFVWDLVGFDPEHFPVEVPTGDLSEADLVRLLHRLFQADPIENADFWQRLGRHVNLEILQELRSQSPHPNLDGLINQNQHSFGGRHAAVMRWMDSLEGAELAWRIEDGFLELVGGNSLIIRFAIDGSRLARREPVPGPQAREFLDRLSGQSLFSAQTESATYRLSIEALRGSGVDETVQEVKRALGATARLTAAEVELHGTRCRINFGLRRLRVEQSLTVGALSVATADFLLGANADDLDQIKRFVGPAGLEQPQHDFSLPGEMSLFDIE